MPFETDFKNGTENILVKKKECLQIKKGLLLSNPLCGPDGKYVAQNHFKQL